MLRQHIFHSSTCNFNLISIFYVAFQDYEQSMKIEVNIEKDLKLLIQSLLFVESLKGEDWIMEILNRDTDLRSFSTVTGCSDNEQFSDVPPYQCTGMDSRLVVGQERSNMVNGRSSDNRARRLLQVQRKCSSLLQKKPSSCWFAPWCSLQSAILQLLQGWSIGILGTGSGWFGLRLSGECWASWHYKQDCKIAEELHSAWSRTRLHMRTCKGCAVYSFPHSWSPSKNSSTE